MEHERMADGRRTAACCICGEAVETRGYTGSDLEELKFHCDHCPVILARRAGSSFVTDDKAGVYTVERFAAIGGWATVWGNSPEEAAAAMWEKVWRGDQLEQEGEPDGAIVLVVRAVAGWDRPIADDLADAIS